MRQWDLLLVLLTKDIIDNFMLRCAVTYNRLSFNTYYDWNKIMIT